MKRLATSAIFFALLILVWEALSRTGWYSPVLLPSPLFVGEYLWQAAQDGTLWTATFVTMRRLIVGYFIFTDWLGIGDTDVFDWGGIVGAIIGVVILLPFVGIVARATGAGRRPAE